MRTRIATFVAVFGLAGLLVAAPATGAVAGKPPPVTGGTLVEKCYDSLGHPLNSPPYAICRGFQALVDAVASVCRLPGRQVGNDAVEADCRLVDGRRITEAQIGRYRKSWVHRALRLQLAMGRRAPLDEEQIPATHNSFNASSYLLPAHGRPAAYLPSLTNQDPNQVYSITDQLRMDIRGLELDLHWVPSIYGSAATGGHWVDVCHGQSTPVPNTPLTVHVGCTVDRSLQNTLAEIRAWLHRHPHAFLLIYLENQLDGKPQAHHVATRLIRQGLGHLVARPPHHLASGDCASMPYRRSEARLARHGAQVLLVGNCGPGHWNRWVFTRGPKWVESGNPTTYTAADCRADQAGHESHTVFRRWYEESPFLEAAMGATQTLTPAATRGIVRCGANLTGWDQLMPRDGRLRAFVWSWARGEPSAGGRCAYAGGHGRFHASRCGVRRHAACVDRSGDWHVTDARGPAVAGSRMCSEEFPRSRYGVPPDGYRDAQLAAAEPRHHRTVWVHEVRARGRWRAR